MNTFRKIFRAAAAALFFLPATAWAEGAKRLVSLLPSHTEMLLMLGAEADIVGVSDAETAGTLPHIPRIGGLAPNWEALVDIRPDLILADVCHEPFQKNFARFRLPVVFLPSTTARSFEDVFALARRIAQYAGKTTAAETWIAGAQTRLAQMGARVPRGAAPRVYLEIWPKPLQAAGPGSLQGFLLTAAGADNIVPMSHKELPLISQEWVVSQAPEIILHTGVVSTGKIAGRPGWGRIPAVQLKRIYIVNRDKISRAGPRILDAYEELIDTLYGKAAPK